MPSQTPKLCLKNTFIDSESDSEHDSSARGRAQSEPGSGWRPSEQFFQDEAEYVGNLNDRADDAFQSRSERPDDTNTHESTDDITSPKSSVVANFGSMDIRDFTDADLSTISSSNNSVDDSAESSLGVESQFESPPQSVTATNPGSIGHPYLCRRPCRFFAVGECTALDNCAFCHIPHNMIASNNHLDKRNRNMLKRLTDEKKCTVFALAMREKVNEVQFPASSMDAVEVWAAQIHRACGAEFIRDIMVEEDAWILRRTVTYLSRLSITSLCNLARGKLDHPGISEACRRLLDHLYSAIPENTESHG